MMRRLRDAAASPRLPTTPREESLRLGEAAFEAGVTTGTILKWANCAELERVHTLTGRRYPRGAVRARARLYWQNIRFQRVTPPQWLLADANADA
jgi:hypothetical protein